MKVNISKQFKTLNLHPYSLDLYNSLIIFALNQEQYVNALLWYNNNINKNQFNASDLELCLDNDGLTTCVLTKDNKANATFQVIYINVQALLEIEHPINNVSPIGNLMATVAHEIEHCVLNFMDHLNYGEIDIRKHEPLCYLNGWLTSKFFEEIQRQGYSFTHKKL